MSKPKDSKPNVPTSNVIRPTGTYIQNSDSTISYNPKIIDRSKKSNQ